jgi:hypothetical protein
MHTGIAHLRLSDGRVLSCPRLLTGQHLTALLNLPAVILSRVGHLASGDPLRIFRSVSSDNTLHHLGNYDCLLFADLEWLGYIDQLFDPL